MRIFGIVFLALLLQGCDVGFNYISTAKEEQEMSDTLALVEKCRSIGMDARVSGGWFSRGHDRTPYYKVSCVEKQR